MALCGSSRSDITKHSVEGSRHGSSPVEQAEMVKFILPWWESSCSSWGTPWCLQLNGALRRQELFSAAGCFILEKGVFAAESFTALVVAISYSHAGFKKGKRTQTTLQTHPSC